MAGFKQDRIKVLLKNTKFDALQNQFTPLDIASSLDFDLSLVAAYQLFFSDFLNEERKVFAYTLLCEVKALDDEQWNASWKNEALLGMFCDDLLKYDERYNHFKLAYEMGGSNHPGLLIRYANCAIAPGKDGMSYDYSLNLLNIAMSEHLYYIGATIYSMIYSFKRDSDNHLYWKKIADDLKDQDEYELPSIFPACIESFVQRSTKS